MTSNEYLCEFGKKPGSLPVAVSTFAQLLQTTAEKHPHRRFLGQREYLLNNTRGQFEWYLFKDVYRMVTCFARALTEIGLKRGDRVGIISTDRTEWNVVDIACASLGVSLVPVYDTMSVEDVKFVINDAEIKICFSTIDKIDRISGLGVERIVVFDDRFDDKCWLRDMKFKVPEKVLFNVISTEQCDLLDEKAGMLDTHLPKKQWLDFKKTGKICREAMTS